MRRSAVHILLLLCVLAAGSGCGREARVIPERKMVRLYAEMFVADQWLRDNADARKIADTTLFFDPIFRANGITFGDYDRSIHYYLDHPEKYAGILTKVAERLRTESEAIQAVVNAEQERQSERDRYHRLYGSTDFSTDSLRWSGADILWPVRAGAEEGAPADSLRAAMSDTLRTDRTEPTDTLRAEPAAGPLARESKAAGEQLPRRRRNPLIKTDEPLIMIQEQ